MQKVQFIDEQIMNILGLVETGQNVGDACRSHGSREAPYERRKAKYGGMDMNQVRRSQQLEDENRCLKHAADLSPALRAELGSAE